MPMFFGFTEMSLSFKFQVEEEFMSKKGLSLLTTHNNRNKREANMLSFNASSIHGEDESDTESTIDDAIDDNENRAELDGTDDMMEEVERTEIQSGEQTSGDALDGPPTNREQSEQPSGRPFSDPFPRSQLVHRPSAQNAAFSGCGRSRPTETIQLSCLVNTQLTPINQTELASMPRVSRVNQNRPLSSFLRDTIDEALRITETATQSQEQEEKQEEDNSNDRPINDTDDDTEAEQDPDDGPEFGENSNADRDGDSDCTGPFQS